MNFIRRSMTGLFLCALTVGLLAWAGFSTWSAVQARLAQEAEPGRAQERVFAVNVSTVTPQDITPILETFGELQSRRALELRAAASGALVFLDERFEEGGHVEAGQLLARIDQSTAQASVEGAQADLHEAEANQRDAERTLAIARDDLLSAQSQADLRAQALTRQRNLKDRGVTTDAVVEEAELTVAAANQSVLSKRQSVANAEAARDQAGTAMLRAQLALAEAQRTLADTELKAAFSGTLSDVTAVEGGLVSANEQLGILIDPDALEVSFRVSTQQYTRLLSDSGKLIGSPITVSLDVGGLDLLAEGIISRESASVTTGQTGRLLFARLDQATGLRPGDFVTVRVREPALSNVARLPATAVDAANSVLVVDDDARLQSADVSVLRRQGDDVLIAVADLAGRQVVSERSPLLGAGLRVRILNGESDGAPRPQLARAGPAESGAMLELTPERRAALIAFVESNERMPAEVKQRVLAQLSQDTVAASVVERLEQRMGG